MEAWTRWARKTSMARIAVPTRLPRSTSLGILAGITNITRLNRLTWLTRMTTLPILGKLVQNGKTSMGRRKW